MSPSAQLAAFRYSQGLDRADNPLLLEPEKLQTLTGLEAWFDLPNSLKGPSGPKRYKQAVLVWVEVMLVSIVLQPLLAPLFAPLPQIRGNGV